MAEAEQKFNVDEEKLDDLLSEARLRERSARKKAALYTLLPVIIGIAFLTVSLIRVSRLEKTAGDLNLQIESKKTELSELEARKKAIEESLTVTTTTLVDINKDPRNAQQKAGRALQIISAKGQPSPVTSPAPTSAPTPKPTATVTGRTGDVDYSKVFSTREVDQKAQILDKPKPCFTYEAAKNGIIGTVRLRVVLAASGEVTNITVTNGLSHGLTECAINAARQLKFQPAKKDGKAVSQYATLEYNFNLL